MLDDKYRIERLIATGGMGAVYLGTHIKLRKRVAIKVLNPLLSTAPMVERFHREAITASQIGHEGIAQVTDMGTSSEGEPFLVMEYLEGESLASRLEASGPLGVEDACELGCSILSPLSAAHRAGIIHRDLKPDNVFLVRQSRGEMVKLLDFGISRASGLDPKFRLTMTGLVLGTPYYMSPEQARGESEITPAADLYAFGVILYEMLVGEVPIRADNYNQLMYRVMIGDFARPREQRPDLPEKLERIILRALAQDPADRPAEVELEQVLLGFSRPVFREHASGRFSTPGLSIRTGTRLRDPAADHSMFAGPTMSDGDPLEVDLAAGDTSYDLVTGSVARADEDDGQASRPALPASAASNNDPSPNQAARRSRKARTLIGIGIGIAVVVVGAVVGGLSRPAGSITSGPTTTAAPALKPAAHPDEVPSARPVTPVAPVAPTPENTGSAKDGGDHPEAHEATTITLRLAVLPTTAAIMLDGIPISGTEIAVPKDDSRHRLRITAAGYVGYDEPISFDESQRLVVQLRRAASSTHVKPPHKDPAKTEPPQQPDRTDRLVPSPYH
jgi:serine/threonine-protein kinase